MLIQLNSVSLKSTASQVLTQALTLGLNASTKPSVDVKVTLVYTDGTDPRTLFVLVGFQQPGTATEGSVWLDANPGSSTFKQFYTYYSGLWQPLPTSDGVDLALQKRPATTYSVSSAMSVVNITDYGAVVSKTKSVRSTGVMSANTAALQAAINAALAAGGGRVLVPGFCHINDTLVIDGTNYTALTPYFGIRIEIVGTGYSAIICNHATKPGIVVKSNKVRFELDHISVWGRGTDTIGNLVELHNVQHWSMNRVELNGSAGRALYLNNSERGSTYDLDIISCRQAIVESGFFSYNGNANNETYYKNTRLLGCGATLDPVTLTKSVGYSTNPTDFLGRPVSGAFKQDKHAMIHLSNSVNVKFEGGSIKPTYIAAIKLSGTEQVELSHLYIEGYSSNGGCVNPSIIMGGASEKTTLTVAIDNAVLSIPVANTDWFTGVASISEVLDQYGTTSVPFVIYDPADVNTYEIVTVKYFYNGSAVLAARGTNSTTARAWASGVVIREWNGTAALQSSDLAITGCHLSSYQNIPAASTFSNALATGDTAGEIISGYTFDEFHFDNGRVGGKFNTITLTNNRARDYGLLNSGSLQVWSKYTNIISPDGAASCSGLVTLASATGITQADPVAANATYANYSMRTGTRYLASTGSQNLAYGVNWDVTTTIDYGGIGYQLGVIGEQGVRFGKTSSMASRFVSYDEKTENGFKFRYWTGSAWTYDIALLQASVKIGAAGIYFNAGAPNGVVTANPGAICLNTSGGANTTLYVKESGTATNTGWVPK